MEYDTNILTFDGIGSDEFNCLLLSDDIAGAIPDYEPISIPGRNGDLRQSNRRFFNRERRAVIYSDDAAKTHLEDFIAYLSSIDGYARIESTIWSDFYMMGCFKGDAQIRKSVAYAAGRAELLFDCKPEKYLLSGETETTYNSSASIVNPTRYTSKPLIRVTQGTGTMRFGSLNVIVHQAHADMVIDCETEDIYGSDAHANYNDDVSLTNHEFPTFAPGTNNIIVPTGMVIKIAPRWWTT